MQLHQLPDHLIPPGYISRDPCALSKYEAERINEAAQGKNIQAWYWYATGYYEGCGYIIILRDATWYLHNMSHCSCYGPTCEIDLVTGYPSLDELLAACSDECRSHLAPLAEMIRNPNTERKTTTFDFA